MKQKICIMGTHGCGKSTLSYMMASNHKKEGSNVKIVQEVARTCPYSLNEGMTHWGCLWIYHEHMKKELDAMKDHEVVICDRSVMDSFIYAKVKGCFHDWMEVFEAGAYEWMKTYNRIIYVTPGSKEPIQDGTRSVDKKFQIDVKNEFDKWLSTYDHKYDTITADDIFLYGGII